jgi:hypothetical protein
MKLFTRTRTKDCTDYTLGKSGDFSLAAIELENTELSLILGYYQNWAALALNLDFQRPRWYLQLDLSSCPEGWLQLSLGLPGVRLSLYLGSVWYRYSEAWIDFLKS